MAEAISESPDVLVCKLVDGKVTYVHRRLWPALVKLAGQFRRDQLAQTWNEHTATGAHRSRRTAFPAWVPSDVHEEATRLSTAEAELDALAVADPECGPRHDGALEDIERT